MTDANEHRLSPDALYARCDPQGLGFETSDQAEALEGILGQDRALEALRFGTGIGAAGYNIFASGPPGAGKYEIVSRYLSQRAADQPTPDDWCYVNNFQTPNRPRLLRLPAGQGDGLRRDLQQLVHDLRAAIPATFASDEYQHRLQELREGFRQRQQQAFQEVQEEAEAHDIALIQTQQGFTFAPKTSEGEVMSAEQFHELPEEQRKQIEETIEGLQQRLQKVVRQMPKWRKESMDQARKLNEQMAGIAVGDLIEELKHRYMSYPEVTEHLDAIRSDVVENVEALQQGQDGDEDQAKQILARYRANAIVHNGTHQGAPVVYEDLPTHQRLIGRIEHRVLQGAMVTDYRLIRAGALHRANGGYLILDARKLLMQPLAWETLKRALRAGTVRTESFEQLYAIMSTEQLEPEPMPLDVKVVLLGDRLIYYLLAAYDPELESLFKVQADFEEDLQRGGHNDRLYARMIAGLAQREGLQPLTAAGVARAIEHASRLAEDNERVATGRRPLLDLLCEADHWAREEGASTIDRGHIQRAIDQQTYRASRLRDRIDRAIQREILMIETTGSRVAQINGLSVMQLGGQAFGRPTRITATARLGRGTMVDIEREAKLGGNIHSKGVMILSAYLAGRYAPEHELSLSASLAFEQSYGLVEGDSASAAELCALLSALADAPLSQSLAITGSVNQHGRIQAIGGANEKIEGFFDVCQQRGLDGQHGVIIPSANASALMLREDVREAAQSGRFHIYAIDTVDQALELLTGKPAGARGDDGLFAEESVNRRVEERLIHFANISRRHGRDNERLGQADDEQH